MADNTYAASNATKYFGSLIVSRIVKTKIASTKLPAIKNPSMRLNNLILLIRKLFQYVTLILTIFTKHLLR